MNEPSQTDIEQLLGHANLGSVSSDLREQVLQQTRRELRAACWDRRLGRVAAVLLLVGVGLNASSMWLTPSGSSWQTASRPSPESISNLETTMAEATDPETGRRLAQHYAAHFDVRWRGEGGNQKSFSRDP
jgi:hypothetical protein